LITDVSGQLIRSIFKGQAVKKKFFLDGLIHKHGIGTMSRNVGNQLAIYAVQNTKMTKISKAGIAYSNPIHFITATHLILRHNFSDFNILKETASNLKKNET
jgi:hypothetical protein